MTPSELMSSKDFIIHKRFDRRIQPTSDLVFKLKRLNIFRPKKKTKRGKRAGAKNREKLNKWNEVLSFDHSYNINNRETIDNKSDCPNKTFHRDKIRLLNVNCCSLISNEKKRRMDQLLVTHKPDVVTATETHIDNEVSSASIFNEEYITTAPFRKDRRLGEGGVLIALRNNTVGFQKDTSEDCELVWTKISHTKGDVMIGCFYRQPSSGIEILEKLQESLTRIRGKRSMSPHIILAGDFNLPNIDWETLTVKQNPQYGKEINGKMIEIATEFNLIQIVKEPTRGKNVLDLIFTTNPDLIEKTEIHPGMSDHDAVICDIKLKLEIDKKPPREVWVYSKGNMDGIREDLKNHEQRFICQAKDTTVENLWKDFKSIIMGSIDKHIPKKLISGKPHLPWLTPYIKRMIRKKQRRYNRAKRSGKDQDWNEYRKLRKTIHAELRKEHNKYVNDMIEPTPNDKNKGKISTRFWKYVRNKRKDTVNIASLKRKDGSEATAAEEKCNILNKHYQSAFTNENKTLPRLEDGNIPSIHRIEVTQKGVLKQLQNLNPKKAAGPDLIPTRVLKECANEVTPYLCTIFQLSLDKGKVPSDWKHARITAIYKKGKRDLASNYRPVSLTSVTCKILEHIIFHSIINHYEKHNILVDHQHGFRKSRSCETQLINTIEAIATSLEKQKQVDLLVLDFSKAFDSVPHKRLLLKLERSGVRNLTSEQFSQKLLSWFEDWLCSRTQEVVLDGKESEKAHVLSGVPQGTVLGPLCFLIYINDLGNNLSPETTLNLFADDSLLFRIIEDKNDTKALQSDLESLLSWSSKWQMNFHPDKCFVMTITNKRSQIRHEYDINGQSLKHVDSIPYLGVHLNNTLTWEHHVNYIVGKANRTLAFLCRNLAQCPRSVKEHLYRALVMPLLEYASSAWDPHQQNHIKKIEQVQRTASRFVTNQWSREPGRVTSSLQSLRWQTLQSRRQESRLKIFHKCIHGQSSIRIPGYLKHQDCRYNTRNNTKSKFVQPFAKINSYKNSFFPRTIKNFNALPPCIRDIEIHDQFERALEIYFRATPNLQSWA